LCLCKVCGCGRKPAETACGKIFFREVFQSAPPLAQRHPSERTPVCAGEQVENDVDRRSRYSELPHPGGRGMKAEQEIIERKGRAAGNPQLAVERELLWSQLRKGFDDLGKISRQGLTGLGLQFDLRALAKSQATESIPFRL